MKISRVVLFHLLATLLTPVAQAATDAKPNNAETSLAGLEKKPLAVAFRSTAARPATNGVIGALMQSGVQVQVSKRLAFVPQVGRSGANLRVSFNY